MGFLCFGLQSCKIRRGSLRIIHEWFFAPTLILRLLNLGYSLWSLEKKALLRGNKLLDGSALILSSAAALLLGPGLKVTDPKGWLHSLVNFIVSPPL